MLKRLEQQAGAREQRYSEGCLDNDKQMLTPMALPACCAPASLPQCLLASIRPAGQPVTLAEQVQVRRSV
jgi:hypothetical protein